MSLAGNGQGGQASPSPGGGGSDPHGELSDYEKLREGNISSRVAELKKLGIHAPARIYVADYLETVLVFDLPGVARLVAGLDLLLVRSLRVEFADVRTEDGALLNLLAAVDDTSGVLGDRALLNLESKVLQAGESRGMELAPVVLLVVADGAPNEGVGGGNLIQDVLSVVDRILLPLAFTALFGWTGNLLRFVFLGVVIFLLLNLLLGPSLPWSPGDLKVILVIVDDGFLGPGRLSWWRKRFLVGDIVKLPTRRLLDGHHLADDPCWRASRFAISSSLSARSGLRLRWSGCATSRSYIKYTLICSF